MWNVNIIFRGVKLVGNVRGCDCLDIVYWRNQCLSCVIIGLIKLWIWERYEGGLGDFKEFMVVIVVMVWLKKQNDTLIWQDLLESKLSLHIKSSNAIMPRTCTYVYPLKYLSFHLIKSTIEKFKVFQFLCIFNKKLWILQPAFDFFIKFLLEFSIKKILNISHASFILSCKLKISFTISHYIVAFEVSISTNYHCCRFR